MALNVNEHAHREAATPQQDKRRILSRNSIAAPTGIVAIYTVRDDSVVTTRYLTTDHAGSISPRHHI